MSKSNEKKITPAEELECIKKLGDKMYVTDYNKIISDIRLIADKERGIDEQIAQPEQDGESRE